MTLLPDIVHDLVNPSILCCFSLGACWLVHLELEIIYPEVSAVEIPVLVLLEDLACLFRLAFNLPEKTCPFGSESALSIDVAFSTFNLASVDVNGSVKATVTALKICPGDDGFDVAR